MNVAFDPWIPVVTPSGERRLASVMEILTNGSGYADLAVRPHERVALMRLFLSVAHAALDGPEDHRMWSEVPKTLPVAARRYLEKWRGSFELFDKKKPWLQVATISKSQRRRRGEDDLEDWTPVSKLDFALATGNNSTLFDHSGGSENRRIALEQTVVSMLAFQCFSPGGLISQVYWSGMQSEKTSKDAPCVPESMVHALVRGETLFHSVHCNLPVYKDVRRIYGSSIVGKPIWEKPPVSFSDSKAIENATRTYVGRLVPMTRLIRLDPSGARMLLGDGLVYPTYDDFSPEPTATVTKKKSEEGEKRSLLSFRPSKALWRELHAIVVKRAADQLGGPLALGSIPDDEGCDLVVAAVARNKATIVDTVESVFHVSSRLRSSEGAATYEREVNSAEAVAIRLGWAVEEYRKALDGSWDAKIRSAGPSKGQLSSRLRSTATSHYWTAVQEGLSLLFAHTESLGTGRIDSTRSAWRRMLIGAGCESYELACGRKSPRQIRAFAQGWQKLILSERHLSTVLNGRKEKQL